MQKQKMSLFAYEEYLSIVNAGTMKKEELKFHADLSERGFRELPWYLETKLMLGGSCSLFRKSFANSVPQKQHSKALVCLKRITIETHSTSVTMLISLMPVKFKLQSYIKNRIMLEWQVLIWSPIACTGWLGGIFCESKQFWFLSVLLILHNCWDLFQ